MRPEFGRALAAAHFNRDEQRFQAVIREIIVNEPDQAEVERWRAMLSRKAEADAKPKATTLLDGRMVLVAPVHLDEVVLAQDARNLVDRWIREMRHREALQARRIPVRNGALFFGASGTGKTMLASAVATALGLPCYSVRTAEVIGMHLGESSKAIAKVLGTARATPMVVVFDELDSIGFARDLSADGSSGGAENARTTNAFLQELDRGVDASIVIGTTNAPQLVDGALRRRLPFRVEFTTPTREQIAAFMVRVAARHGLERAYEGGPTNYAEAEHEALCDVRDHVINELEKSR